MFVFKGDKSDNSWETFKYKISLKTTRIDLAEEIERGIRINRRGERGGNGGDRWGRGSAISLNRDERGNRR